MLRKACWLRLKDQTMQRETQSAFSDGLISGGATPPGVVDPFGKPAPKRYGVYQNNVVVSLIGALTASFPAVSGIIGEEIFGQMARAFITHSQPQSPMLAEYGQEMPEFLDMSEPLQHMPYLADVARLELVWLKSYHGADALALTPETFAALGDEALVTTRFALHPCTHVLSSQFALFDIWHAGRQDGSLDEVDISKAQGALVTRPGIDVLVAAITPPQIEFFEKLASGAHLGEAIESAMDAGEFDLPATLQLMISSGALMSVIT